MQEDKDKKITDADKPKPGGGDKPPDNGGDKLGDSIRFKVNGVELKTRHAKLVALDILEMAAKKGALAGKPEDYFLQSISGEQKYKPDDWVEIKQGEEFIATPQGPTPVA